ncbi:MAG: thioredoxin family protein, partial [Vallitaleaceae bacterium]|nr:thioredoxin family protein [Vallitaleaceae bacterium]
MKLLNEELITQLEGIFSEMPSAVTLAVFTQEGPCETCTETISFMEEIAEVSDKISLVKYTKEANADMVEQYQIELYPSIILLDAAGEYHGVKFNGMPAGHEFNSFIPAILETGGASEEVPAELAARIAKIDKPINIKVFVTLSCPHCPGAVQTAHKLAMLNKNVNAEMVEAQTFMELSQKHGVSGVPKIVINDE